MTPSPYASLAFGVKPLRLFSLVAALAACESPPRPTAPPSPARPSRALTLAPPSTPAPEGPPAADAGALPPALARCIARNRASLAPELSAALSTLDAASLLEDACRLELAPRGRSVALCEGVRLSPLRDTCKARAAMVSGAPGACPTLATEGARDPVCVAIAARDRRLCAAARVSERPRCMALAQHAPGLCESLDPLLSARCADDLRALEGLIDPLREGTPYTGTASLTVGLDDAAAPTPLRFVERGVFVEDGRTLSLVEAALGWPSAALHALELRVALRARVALRSGLEVPVEARIELPGVGLFDTRDGTLSGTLRWEHTTCALGGHLAGVATLRGTSGGATRVFTLRFDSFVRDLLQPAADAAGRDGGS